MNHRIELFHDFNKLYDSAIEGWVQAPLICFGSHKQLEEENIILFEGQTLLLIDPDGVDEKGNPDRLEVEAVIHFDIENGYWFGEFEHSKLKYRSEKRYET
jgi:hypothetical protein